jgi:hypothetical protein
METWKDCVGYESFYQVSDKGQIRSLCRPVKTMFGVTTRGGNYIKKIVAKNGYEVVNFTTGPKKRHQELVHRLVLTAFIGECPKNMEACHNDGVRTNNELENLRWDTRKSNHQDKRNHGTYQEGAKGSNVKLTIEQVKEIYQSNLSGKKLAKIFNVGETSIFRVKKQKTWSCVTNENKN